MMFDPKRWFWVAEDDRVYKGASGQIVDASDADLAAFQEGGGIPTHWPRDETGAQTDAALQDVLTLYGMSVPGFTAVPASVSSAQAKIQCLRTPGAETGKTLLDDITGAVQGVGGEAQIWFTESRTWERTNPYVASLSGVLKLTSAQVDQLFIAAAQIAA